MAGGITFKIDDVALKKLVLFDQREKRTQKYLDDVAKLRKERPEGIRQKLSDLRRKYIEEYILFSPEINELNLPSFVETLFFEFDRNKFVVQEVLDARKEVLNQFAEAYKDGKIDEKSLLQVYGLLGTDAQLRDELQLGELGKENDGEMSLVDAMIINRRAKHGALYTSLKKIIDEFSADNAYFVRDLEQFHENRVKGCFNSDGCEAYMKELFEKAQTFRERKDKKFDKVIKKAITEVKETEISKKSERIYLDLRYETTESRQVRESQSIADYKRYGAKYRTETTTEVHQYNPDYISENLPEGVKLVKDKRGCYLVQDAFEVTPEQLEIYQKKYTKKFEASKQK